jgi:hypothetical protein
METRKLTMSHAIWAQRTPRMAYNMQVITVFHVAWKRGWSPVRQKCFGGMLHPHILLRENENPGGYFCR